jgi:hypothetical protein
VVAGSVSLAKPSGVMETIANHGVNADLHTFRNPEELRQFVGEVAREAGLG